MAAPIDKIGERKQSTFHPGAAPYGNFINYYSFNPPTRRLELIPRGLLALLNDRIPNDEAANVCVLDVGCNTGDLTVALYQHLLKGSVADVQQTSGNACEPDGEVIHVPSSEKPRSQGQTDEENLTCIKHDTTNGKVNTEKMDNRCSGNNTQIFVLGCDIDEILIQRATEANQHLENLTFQQINVMDLTNSSRRFSDFLDARGSSSGLFDLTTCFSITMWIHLHHGDQGLMTFLRQLSRRTRYLLIEPQPWKCYKSAVKRVKKLKQPIEWLSLNELGIKEDVVEKIETYLVKECNLEIVLRLGETEWERQLLLLRNTKPMT